MEDRLQQPTSDITKEEYEGPSTGASAVGQSVIEHWKWAGFGLGTGIALALVFPKPSLTLVTNLRNFAKRVKAEDTSGVWPTIKEVVAKLVHGVFGEGRVEEFIEAQKALKDKGHIEWMTNAAVNREHGFGSWLLSHTFGLIPPIEKFINGHLCKEESRWSLAVTIGEAFAAFGYIGGLIKGFFGGAEHSHRSREQFQRAKEEIIGLRNTQYAQQKLLADVTKQLRSESASSDSPSTQVASAAVSVPAHHDHAATSKLHHQPAEGSWAEHTQQQDAYAQSHAIH